MLGLFSPFKFELEEYKEYNITKFRDNIRFLEVLVNRDGEMGGLCPLFFDGAVCDFQELPLPGDKNGLARIYKYLDYIRGENSSAKLFFNVAERSTKNKLKRCLHRWKRLFIFA